MSRNSSRNDAEVSKLHQHLSLLRDQYSILQERCEQLQHEKDMVVVTADGETTTSFASRLLAFVTQLYDKEDYSDIQVLVGEGRSLRAHRFVLTARSKHWADLPAGHVLDWAGLGVGVGETVLRWVYSGHLQSQHDTTFMMLLMTAASKLMLGHLLARCEEVMVGRVRVGNCVRLYTTAEEIGAETLRNHCSTLISAHWDDFTSADFQHMSAPLLYAMFKSKTQRPLHAAVRHRREDVLFLYLIEFRAQLPAALDQRDNTGSVVLEVALMTGQQSVADTLLEHGADPNTQDATGATLLHRAVARGDEFAAKYLLNHGAGVNTQEKCTGMTPLHVLVSGDPDAATTRSTGPPPAPDNSNYYTTRNCFTSHRHNTGANTAINCDYQGGSTGLTSGYSGTTETLTGVNNGLTTGYTDSAGIHTELTSGYSTTNETNAGLTSGLPAASIETNVYNNTNCVNNTTSPNHSLPDHSNSSLHSTSPSTFSNTNSVDSATSSFTSMQKVELCKLLLEKGADPNIQDRQKRSVYHCGVLSGECSVLSILLSLPSSTAVPALEAVDCEGRTALWYALFQSPPRPGVDWSSQDDVTVSMPAMLVLHGADPDAVSGSFGDTLLHVSGQLGATAAGLFLASRGGSVNTRNRAGETPLHCAATTGMPTLTAAMLQNGANPNIQTLATVPVSSTSIRSSSNSTSSSSSGGSGRGSCSSGNINMSHATTVSATSQSSNATTPSTNPFEELDTPPPQTANTTTTSVNESTLVNNASTPYSSPVAMPVYKQTPLHRAVANHNHEDIRAILKYKASPPAGAALDLELHDSNERTSLGSALCLRALQAAEDIIAAGADLAKLDTQGRTYLHIAVEAADVKTATFLLDQGANPSVRNRDGQTPLEVCISGGVADVALVEQLCKGGAAAGGDGAAGGGVLDKPPPLWQALTAGMMDVATVIVKFGADVDWWHDAVDGVRQTLLHRALDENLEEAAVFLLDGGCDVNHPRHPRGAAGGGDLLTPLHLCATWGLHTTAQALLQHQAKINAKDTEGKTSLHLAIENGHAEVTRVLLSDPLLDLSLRDKSGTTAFAAAMTRRNNIAAKAILDREPKAAQQFDHKGHNFLHVAVAKGDLESVLFLLSIHVDLSTRTRDDQRLCPLHLATNQGSELLVRNLLLAGCDVNALTPHKQTSLHLAALHDHSNLAPVLLENAVAYDSLDDDLNNALHVAVKHGHVGMTRVLLTESSINAVAVNLRGQNPLHLLACHLPAAAPAITKLFLEAMPDYPLDAPDVHGSTALLLAYQRGGGQLCRVLVAAGAGLGRSNQQGENLFNSAVASRALLAALLDSLATEPPWSDGELCMECCTKFNLATRRHHCRHCGRLLCSKCSDKLLPILKFGLNKPVRVCHICSQVITLGPGALT